MAAIRHLRMVVRSSPVVLALVLMSVLGAQASARPAAAGTTRVPAVAVAQLAPVAARVAAPTRAQDPAVPATALVTMPVAERAGWLSAQRVADVRVPRAPPAVVV